MRGSSHIQQSPGRLALAARCDFRNCSGVASCFQSATIQQGDMRCRSGELRGRRGSRRWKFCASRSRSARNWSCKFDPRDRDRARRTARRTEGRRIGGQRARHAHALALAAGKLARIALPELRRDQDRPASSSSAVRAAMRSVRPAFKARNQADIFGDGEVREQADVLDHVADAAPELDQVPGGGRTAFDQNFACGGETEAH